MLIDPNLEQNAKYKALRKAVGVEALYVLLRLWGHCQDRQRGANWGKVGPKYVEAVCDWSGEEGKLFEALTTPIFEGKKPFLEVKKGAVVVHDWAQVNKALIAAWKNGGRGGRPPVTRGNPTANPGVTNGQPIENPIRPEEIGYETTKSSTYSLPLAEAPSRAEWIKHCLDLGLPEWKAIREFDSRGRNNWQDTRNWRKHAVFIRTIWEQDGRPKNPPTPAGYPRDSAKNGPESLFFKIKRAEALQKVVEQHPGRTNRLESGDPTPAEEKDFREKSRELAALRAEIATKPN